MSVDGKVVLITGGGRGIGAGVARCFDARGSKVVVTDLDEESVAQVRAGLVNEGLGLVADASSSEAMALAVDRVLEQFGQLDVLVNNAGIGGPDMRFEEAGAEGSAMFALSDDEWDRQLTTNLRTTFSSSKAAAAKLAGGGSIINIASIAALQPTPSLAAYGAAKAGVAHLTRSLAVELAPRRIRVNCICPGLLWTRAWEILGARIAEREPEMAGLSPRQVFEAIVAQSTPLGEEQTPEDIGHLAVFWASNEARMITGQVVAVDGGITLGSGG